MKPGTAIATKSGRKGVICEPPFELPGRVLVDFGDNKWWVPEWAICGPAEVTAVQVKQKRGKKDESMP